jgi:2-polyprenyl-3-methyl-5-hydroxy-6-metoxy-1,4-benzoquinol methylase
VPTRQQLPERIFGDALGFFRLLSMYVGLRLGLYEALREAGPLSPAGLAARADIDERYAREWLEQQATAGLLDADVTTDPHTFRLPDEHAEALLDGNSLSYSGATIRQLMSLRGAIDDVVDAFGHGGGVPYERYGNENIDGQGGANRPVFLTTLPNDWLPSIEQFHDRLSAGPSRVIDVGCGQGWSSIALANAYPNAMVDGYDPDQLSVQRARQHAKEAGLEDRVRFHESDAADIEGPADLAMAFECVHDMSDPVSVLAAARRSLSSDGAMLVVDERTRETFDGTPDNLESYFYGWSLFDCLPSGLAAQPSVGTGTVMRPATLRRYAEAAGFTRFDVLPIEHDVFRLYLLRP